MNSVEGMDCHVTRGIFCVGTCTAVTVWVATFTRAWKHWDRLTGWQLRFGYNSFTKSEYPYRQHKRDVD